MLLNKLIRGYFTQLFEDVNSLPDKTTMSLEYYNDAKTLVDNFMLTDNSENVLHMPGKDSDGDPCIDVLANSTTKRMMNKLRYFSAQATLTAGAALGAAVRIPDVLHIKSEQISMGTLRFAPAGEQPWLVTLDNITPGNVPHDQVKMRKDSVLTERVWALILLTYSNFSDRLASLQEKYSATWEKSYLEKALKEDERRKAQHIFSEVKVKLGSSETICTYHRTYDGNDHKNIHCKFSPCYLHTWKCYEISGTDEDGMTVTKSGSHQW